MIVLGNFRLVIYDKTLYKNIQRQSGVYNNFLPVEDINNRLDNLFGFYRSNNILDHSYYSLQARTHLNDVKNMIVFSNDLLYLTLIVFIMAALIFIVKRKTINLFIAIQTSAAVTLAFFLMLGLGVLNYFEPLFTLFHQIVFRNELWLFRPDDTLIMLFPRQFFILFSLRLATNIILTCIFLILLSFVLKRRILNARKRI